MLRLKNIPTQWALAVSYPRTSSGSSYVDFGSCIRFEISLCAWTTAGSKVYLLRLRFSIRRLKTDRHKEEIL
jgi:hypothetical protein